MHMRQCFERTAKKRKARRLYRNLLRGSTRPMHLPAYCARCTTADTINTTATDMKNHCIALIRHDWGVRANL